MRQNNRGELILAESDVMDLVMQGRDPGSIQGMLVDESVDLEQAAHYIERLPELIAYTPLEPAHTDATEFHRGLQARWHMPAEYQTLDIAQHVLNLCTSEAELQRCGQELLLYQERGLFDLLRYLKYLVDVMIQNHVIWGVGRGSSVASFVLYKLGVHRIDSLFYNLDPHEFLR
jgi:hypothetical protein